MPEPDQDPGLLLNQGTTIPEEPSPSSSQASSCFVGEGRGPLSPAPGGRLEVPGSARPRWQPGLAGECKQRHSIKGCFPTWTLHWNHLEALTTAAAPPAPPLSCPSDSDVIGLGQLVVGTFFF